MLHPHMIFPDEGLSHGFSQVKGDLMIWKPSIEVVEILLFIPE
jgi:hypothetical protein